MIWFELPFYRSLSEQILLFGAPKSMIMVNALMAFLFIVNFHFWYIIPVSILFHLLCIYVAKGDTQIFDCLKLYVRKKNYYST